MIDNKRKELYRFRKAYLGGGVIIYDFREINKKNNNFNKDL